jgi:hypothetical protein
MVCGIGFMVPGSGLGSGFMVCGIGFMVPGSGFRVPGLKGLVQSAASL